MDDFPVKKLKVECDFDLLLIFLVALHNFVKGKSIIN